MNKNTFQIGIKMKIKSESGNEKILLALIDANKSITVKLLAEKTGIAYKNIHRNLTQLFENNYITKNIIQESRNRYTYIGITPKGSNFRADQPLIDKLDKSVIIDTSNYNHSTFDDECQIADVQFGIRFYSWLGVNLGIPNAYSLSLSTLKLKIGLKLMEQSKLVDTKSILGKYFNGEK